ncbi:MAG: hypothetical protein JSS79_01085 [Bacteroidetes bacterium]|nr:hypothetical protein [Bacteroidota bacterium]
MGLKEKQAMAGLDFGWSERRIKEYTGKDVKIELAADTFSNDMDAILFADSRGAERMANGIAKVCYNDIGKDAFNEKKVEKVVLKNQAAGSRSITFDGTKLVMACAFTSSDDSFSENEVQELIENQL